MYSAYLHAYNSIHEKKINKHFEIFQSNRMLQTKTLINMKSN